MYHSSVSNLSDKNWREKHSCFIDDSPLMTWPSAPCPIQSGLIFHEYSSKQSKLEVSVFFAYCGLLALKVMGVLKLPLHPFNMVPDPLPYCHLQ